MRPTIAELEEILDGPEVDVEVLPDGELRTKDSKLSCRTAADARAMTIRCLERTEEANLAGAMAEIGKKAMEGHGDCLFEVPGEDERLMRVLRLKGFVVLFFRSKSSIHIRWD